MTKKKVNFIYFAYSRSQFGIKRCKIQYFIEHCSRSVESIRGPTCNNIVTILLMFLPVLISYSSLLHATMWKKNKCKKNGTLCTYRSIYLVYLVACFPKRNGKKFEKAGFRNNRGSEKFVTVNHFRNESSSRSQRTCVITKINSEHYFTMPNNQSRDSRVHIHGYFSRKNTV